MPTRTVILAGDRLSSNFSPVAALPHNTTSVENGVGRKWNKMEQPLTLHEVLNLVKVAPVATLDDLKASLDYWRAERVILCAETRCAWKKYDAAIDSGLPYAELQQLALTAEIMQAKASLAYERIDDLKAQILERGN